MKKTVFIKNAAILTTSSLILRFAGIVFKVWLASSIGAEGIGLYQLVFSVYVLASTFASSGISTAVTRLIADELALGSKNGVKKIFKRSLQLTGIIAVFSTSVVFFGADFIAKTLLGDTRAAAALKILSFSLPFMGICSCIRGYFIARRKASPSALSQLVEQGLRIGIVVMLVKKFFHKGLSYTCAAVLLGDTVSEFCSATFLGLLYFLDIKKVRLTGRSRPPFGIVKELLRISMPITAGRYLNTTLRTGENILVPKGLAKYGSGENALAQFGMIKGMALPILFFPSTLLNALSTLLIPEMSEAAARGLKGLVKTAVTQILRITAIVSFIFAAIFGIAGKSIGILIYKSEDVGFLLCALSPIVPLMYLDSVADGILKGLDQQLSTFRTALFDSIIRILLIIITLPKFGLNGFLGIMYFSNLLTCFLNIRRLLRVSEAKIDLTFSFFLPISSALCVTLFTDTILSLFFKTEGLVYIILLLLISIPIYLLLLFLFKCIKTEDFYIFGVKK